MKEDEVLQLYMEELEAIPQITDEELKDLPLLAKSGDRKAKNRLAEGLLLEICHIALDYTGRGVSDMDLIQEGNMGLMTAIQDYESGDFLPLFEKRVKELMAYAVVGEAKEQEAEEAMLTRVQALDDITQEMQEDLGRMPTLSELAERMKMPEDDVKEIMKVTIDAAKR